jgi:hypothetical protein
MMKTVQDDQALLSRFQDVDAPIAAKEAAGREHDLAAVKQLRAIKENLTRKAPQPKPSD